MVEPKLFTVAEIAALLSVKISTVRTWLAKGELHGLKLPGGDWRVRQEELDRMLTRGE
jgi:excisionase family DNA binding protein